MEHHIDSRDHVRNESLPLIPGRRSQEEDIAAHADWDEQLDEGEDPGDVDARHRDAGV